MKKERLTLNAHETLVVLNALFASEPRQAGHEVNEDLKTHGAVSGSTKWLAWSEVYEGEEVIVLEERQHYFEEAKRHTVRTRIPRKNLQNFQAYGYR